MNVQFPMIILICLLSLAPVAVAQEDVAASPLEDITHDMKVSSSQLSKRVTSKPTQQPQKEAVNKLDALIAKLEEERQQLLAGGQSSANPTVPANASTILSGPGGMGDLHGTRDQKDRWGNLPDHERDRILQSLTEGFPAHYQAILEAYYKRLAVERPTDDADDVPISRPEPAMKSDKPAVRQPASAKAKPAAAMKGRK